ncbi:MAG: acyl carrier protein [Hyphomonadaceae bacterium]|nr:acyl carrier protein [Hyphomonadaceae bacterium]
MTPEQAYSQIVAYLTDTFEIPAEQVRPEALLIDDLGLDSIDAVDLMVKLQEQTGRKVSPDQFENVRTVQDLVTLVQSLTTKK